jgi:hypothetical protein
MDKASVHTPKTRPKNKAGEAFRFARFMTCL